MEFIRNIEKPQNAEAAAILHVDAYILCNWMHTVGGLSCTYDLTRANLVRIYYA